jgi:hypothetical protein
MKIQKAIRPLGCSNGLCPGIILTDEGTVLVQGRKVDVTGALEVPDNETVVAIPQEVFAELINRYSS